jgi:hypothetical protein
MSEDVAMEDEVADVHAAEVQQQLDLRVGNRRSAGWSTVHQAGDGAVLCCRTAAERNLSRNWPVMAGAGWLPLAWKLSCDSTWKWTAGATAAISSLSSSAFFAFNHSASAQKIEIGRDLEGRLRSTITE